VNWTALVTEAIRRRKAENLTQKEHAALASVSIPTIIAFDRGERTLSLAKAFDILRVVGLLEEPVEATSQETFVGEAFARWRDLTKNLPKESPGRFPHGWYRIDYALDGDLKPIELHKFTDVLRKAAVPHTGWPMFRVPRRPELAPREIDGVVECWLAPDGKDIDRMFDDAAHCDFWRAAPEGRAVLVRGYQEDSQETFPEGTIFDTTLPIWRTGEAFLHAARLAKLLAQDPTAATIKLRNLYTGLQGRDLRAWASPMSADYFGGGRSRTNEAMLEGTAPASTVEKELGRYVYPIVSSLFERFGATGISEDFVSAELDRMRSNNFGSRASL
jgi:transcriptional regulator with XRE-family HTH domain